MAENMGGVAAAGAAAAATGTPTTVNGSVTATPASTPAQAAQTAVQNATPTQGQAPGETKTWDVKVDGRVVKMNEAEMREAASLGKAAFKRMEEASGIQKRAEAFMKQFEQDPLGAIDKLNIAPEQKRKMIEEYYKKNYIDQDSLTPEQKELNQLRQEREERKRLDAEQETAKQTETKKQLEGQWKEHYSKVIMEALDKGGLPKTPKTVGRMAFYLAENAKLKLDQTIDQVAARVQADYQEEFQGLAADDAPVEALIKILGPNAVKKLQKYALEQHKLKLSGKLGAIETQTPTTIEPKKKREPEANDGWKKVTNYWTRRDK